MPRGGTYETEPKIRHNGLSTGVYPQGNKFVAVVSVKHKSFNLGAYLTIDEAADARERFLAALDRNDGSHLNLIRRKKTRELPIGIYLTRGKRFRVMARHNGESIYLGAFEDKTLALKALQTFQDRQKQQTMIFDLQSDFTDAINPTIVKTDIS